MKQLIIHHAGDADGIVSAMLLKACLNGTDNTELLGLHNWEKFPDLKKLKEKYSKVHITDISHTVEWMQEWFHSGIDGYWFDHHHKAIESSVTGGYYNAAGKRKVGESATMLVASRWINSPTVCNRLKMIGCVNAADVFDRTFEEVFQEGLNLTNYINLILSQPAVAWQWFKTTTDRYLGGYIETGALIRADRLKIALAMEPMTFLIDGVDIPAINYYCNDLPGSEKYKDHLAILMYSIEAPDRVRLSFRSVNLDFDVSAIAQQFGGGGHKNAAGATISFERFKQLVH